ncbi:hypothetical protein CLF_102482 [Clonorchis sinensis]|uniref:Uncharacterized protein n=1 Tax=Clonorchis sinensis TaxID=79923 RepID=G7Y813_CLOSI|nr:hypothetical protein CLF_102482 [Clonorchis sinensis]
MPSPPLEASEDKRCFEEYGKVVYLQMGLNLRKEPTVRTSLTVINRHYLQRFKPSSGGVAGTTSWKAYNIGNTRTICNVFHPFLQLMHVLYIHMGPNPLTYSHSSSIPAYVRMPEHITLSAKKGSKQTKGLVPAAAMLSLFERGLNIVIDYAESPTDKATNIGAVQEFERQALEAGNLLRALPSGRPVLKNGLKSKGGGYFMDSYSTAPYLRPLTGDYRLMCELAHEQPVTFWTEHFNCMPGITYTTNSSRKPFGRNAAFTTPIDQYLKSTMPGESHAYQR